MNDTLTVSEINAHIRGLLELDERLQDLWVTGEVSNLSRAASGHCYFTLKDSGAQLKCVMWRSAAEKQSKLPQNGDEVVAHGYVSVYDQSGMYQLYVDRVRPTGVGDLYREFERLKLQLEAEGLFDLARKRPMPSFPQQIGIVTSADAAAFQDVQNVLRRRFPVVRVLLAPTLVQGDAAPAQIVRAITKLNTRTDIDVILVCRGGGSIEDLWAFNDENVARAIAGSRIPVISGVGHETDFTIADFAADLRAPTPSAAAEILTPDIEDLRDELRRQWRILHEAMEYTISSKRSALGEKRWALSRVSPEAKLRVYRQRLDDWTTRMDASARGRLALLRERLAGRRSALNAANPQAILARGYAIVTRTEDGTRVTSAEQGAPKPGVGITIQLHDGELVARVEDKETHGRYKRTLF
jgi:exodeoxyribonuclease VII large subunit